MDGVVIVDKPKGITSHAVVQIIKRIYNAKKAGHTGTLDPIATGVLPVCLNGATKSSTELMASDKEYEVAILLGVTTTTYDTEGDIVGRSAVPEGVLDEVNQLLPEFRGYIKQKPPYFSAIKHKGRPLYKWARQGEFINLPPRMVEIKKFEIEDFNSLILFARVVCSKGTYIRALCHDLGKRLGCGACMKGLRRIAAGRFHIRDSVSVSRLEALRGDEKLWEYVMSVGELQ